MNVASIHNATIQSSGILTDDVRLQARTLADRHEWALSYNASESIRAVAGSTLAAQIVQALNSTITNAAKSTLNIQFGAYGTFQSFFGLAQLTAVSSDFYGLPDYASTMTFELFTTSPAASFPISTDDVNVRFLFHNGTTSNSSVPTVYPLFGQKQTSLPWKRFVNGMNKFAIGSQEQWCSACGNSTGICASSTSSNSDGSSAESSPSTDGGISRPVAGVIGAMVTLAVILGVEALVLLLGSFRLVSKKRVAQQAALGESVVTGKA